jgi:hypothetical protein
MTAQKSGSTQQDSNFSKTTNGKVDQRASTATVLLGIVVEWKQLISGASLAIGGILGTFLSEGTAKKASLIIVLIALPLVASGYSIVRKRKRRRKANQQLLAHWRDEQGKFTAFRGLYSFEEGERLPGETRIREARAIATRIASSDFSFGILCGDTGCGKTSLLRSETRRILRTKGFDVVYLRTPHELSMPNSGDLGSSEALSAELNKLKVLLHGKTNTVLILDQFEDFFLKYASNVDREQIGVFLNKLSNTISNIRILCTIRREYLIDIRELAPSLPEPLSVANLFHLKNFDPEQARKVILECATTDGIQIDAEFADTLVMDLQENEVVRPPELQIVCTYLIGNLTTSKYRLAGGAAGILASHVRDAIELCSSPDFAAKLLRVLCRFPEGARSEPKSLTQLLLEAGSTHEGAPASSQVEFALNALEQFTLARLVFSDSRTSGEPLYLLVHDYLVESIKLATSNASTKVEEATQMLRYYMVESRGRIPIFKLREITSWADKSLLRDKRAKKVIRASIISPLIRGTFTMAAGIIIAAAIYVLSTSKLNWNNRTSIDRHWEPDKGGEVRIIRGSGGKIITIDSEGSISKSLPHIQIWDMKTGDRLLSLETDFQPKIKLNSRFLIVNGRRNRSDEFLSIPTIGIDLSTLKRVTLPFLNQTSNEVNFDISTDDIVSYVPGLGRNNSGESYTLNVYSLSRGQLGTISNLRTNSLVTGSETRRVLNDGTRLLVDSTDERGTAPSLYDIRNGSLIARLAKDDEKDNLWVADELHSRVITINRDKALLRIWRLDDGVLLKERRYSPNELRGIQDKDVQWNIETSSDGSRIILSTFNPPKERRSFITEFSPSLIISESSLSIDQSVPRDGMHWVFGQMGVAWMSTPGNAVIMNLSDGERRALEGLDVSAYNTFLVNRDRSRLVVYGDSRRVEIWDLITCKRVKAVTLNRSLVHAYFTIDDTAIAILQEGPVYHLLDARTGESLTDSLREPNSSFFYYDPDCRTILVWNTLGEVVRYNEGREIFGWFLRSRRCNQH